MMPTLHLPCVFPPRPFPLLRALHSMPQDTPSKSSFPSRPRLTRQQTLGGARPYLTASKVCQLISFLAITLCHRSDPRLMLGRKVLKKADLRNMCQALAGAGMATVMPMTRHTVIANFVTDTEIIDRLLDLLRALLPGSMAGLAGLKFAPGHAPGQLGVLRLVPGPRRGDRLT